MHLPGLKGLWILQDHFKGHRFFFCFVCLQAFFRGKLPEMECYLQSATRKDHVGGFVALVEVTRDACLFLPAFQLLFLCWRLWMEIY